MKVCIVGCGAVGSLFAANLAQLDDVEVWAYDLARDHVEAINRDGLRLSGAGKVVGKLRATADAADLPGCDFGIVATKAMHTGAAVEATADAFRDGCVATVQNGIGNEEVLARHVERVIRGTTFPAGKLLAPGHVQWDVKGDTTLGPFEAQPAPLEDLRRVVSGLVDEGKAVAAAQGIELDQDPEELIDHAAKPEVAYDHKASMLQDVEARRPTEVDYLNGGIVRFGEQHGVPTPLNAAIWALVKGLEASWQVR